jgi:DNA polymerase III alpha subunit
MPDIDIDFANRDKILEIIHHVRARRTTDDGVTHHSSGVYPHNIPKDPANNIAGIDYKTAEERGYFKVDLLNVGIYEKIISEDQLVRLMNVEPLWDLLEQKDFCDLVFHVNGYHDLVAKLKPKTIEELSMFLALIRPGKKHLIQTVQEQGWDSVRDEIWTKTDDSYSFKKSHAVAYAHAIVVQMNQICESISYEFS